MNLIFEEIISDQKDIIKIASKINPYISVGSILLLEGDLAAGKTTFVSVFSELCGAQPASSPTYSLINQYEVLNKSEKIIHVDLYRLKNGEDIDSSGFWDIFSDKKNKIFIEWSSRVQSSDWPLGWDIYQLEILKNENSRTYRFSKLQ